MNRMPANGKKAHPRGHAYTPAMRRALSLLAAAALFVAMAAVANRTTARTGEPVTRISLPMVAADAPAAPARPYRMGWFVVSPAPTVESVLQAFPQAVRHGDAVLLQREVPWSRILAGVPMETILEQDYDGLIAYLRGLGFEVSILVDPLDGLDRTQEANETRAAGRTLNDPALRALHEQWVELIAARYRPAYLGLASEINSLAARGDPVLFANIREMCNRLAPRIRDASPATKVFVSFQVDEAWGRPPIPPSPIDQFALTRTFDIDVLGLSSYPSFFFSDPSAIPDDYFRGLQIAAGKPVIMAEGGWSSDPLGTGETPASLAQQKAFYERFFALMDSVQPELIILLLFADLDLEAWLAAAGPGTNVAGLAPFARMGITASNFAPKPALAVWDERFKLPYLP